MTAQCSWRMGVRAIVVCVMTVASSGFLPSASAQSSLGICRSGLADTDEATRQKTLENIHKIGVTWFRDSVNYPSPEYVARFVDELKIAQQQKLKILVNILQLGSDYDGNLSTNTCGWKDKKLSAINLKKYDQRLRDLFGALKAAHVQIDAVEFGNEIDQYCFNADVPNGRRLSASELVTAARGYGEFLKSGAMVLHEYFPEAKIITFGMANIVNNRPYHLENPAQFVAMLRNINGYDYLDNSSYHVDGIGVHVYSSANNISGDATQTLRKDFAALGNSKPFWITEFGFTHNNFPNKKGQTLGQAIGELLGTFSNLSKTMSIGPAFFYSYNGWLVDDNGNLLPAAYALSPKKQ